MYIKRNISAKIILFFSWKELLAYTLLATIALTAYTSGLTAIAIPFLPVATIGTAVAFYVGFKNNASYERLWEARKIWAEIEHLSRFMAMLILADRAQGKIGEAERSLIYRQIAWVNTLCLQLRNTVMFHDETAQKLDHVKLIQGGQKQWSPGHRDIMAILETFTSQEEAQSLSAESNIACRLLFNQLSALAALRSQLPDSNYEKLLDIMADLSQQQAAAERINSFPFPRQYAYFSSVFINIFILLLPFSLLREMAQAGASMVWLTVPFSVLISWIFFTMEKVGETSENPFEGGLNDVPMSKICRDIEIELKSLLQEKNLPQPITAVDSVLL